MTDENPQECRFFLDGPNTVAGHEYAAEKHLNETRNHLIGKEYFRQLREAKRHLDAALEFEPKKRKK